MTQSGIPSARPLHELRDLIALGSRILSRQRVVDSFGHISARHPDRPECFLLPIRKAPDLVERDDIVEFDLEANLVRPAAAPVFLERFIHAAIYAARPDVQSIVHSHSPAVVAISVVTSQPLRAVCHTCGFLGTGVPGFEVRDVAGEESNLLITNMGLGRALAAALGDHAVVLMRGHGSTIVGTSVQNAVYRAVYAEANARIQATALAMGPVTFLSAGEARAAESGAKNIQDERAWASWVRDLREA